MSPKQQKRLDAIRGLHPLTAEEARSVDIRAIKVGGYIQLDGNVWRVQRMNRYLDVRWKDFTKRSSDYWVHELELLSLNTGETRHIEWEVDDELEVFITEREVRLRDVEHRGSPIRFEGLLEIAEAEEGCVTVGGARYYYSEDDTWAGLYYAESGDEPTGRVRFFEFDGDAGTGLTIEAWETDPDDKPEREAFISRPAAPGDVKIVQIEAAG